MTAVLLVAPAGAAGAAARYLLDRAVQARGSGRFPAGTFVINVAGSFALGMIAAGAAGRGTTAVVLGTGFVGTFTTFSTWMLETVRLAAGGAAALAWLNIAASVAAGLLAAWAGIALGSWLS